MDSLLGVLGKELDETTRNARPEQRDEIVDFLSELEEKACCDHNAGKKKQHSSKDSKWIEKDDAASKTYSVSANAMADAPTPIYIHGKTVEAPPSQRNQEDRE
jgi:hypothetical protein